MENLFLKKLQIKSIFKVSVINAPDNAAAIFQDIPSTIDWTYQTKQHQDAYLLFAITKVDLMVALKSIQKSITDKTIVWVFYPKAKTPLAADLNLMRSYDDLLELNLSPCSSVAVNEIWTGIRIKNISSQKKSGISNVELKNNSYGEYIDVVRKTVTLPEDLKAALTTQPKALAHYQQLAYSHKKEYVLWLLTAKQHKTRISRVQKIIEKLLVER